jgi:uncharacterized protein
MRNNPFLSYSEYLKNKYGEKVYRISIDAGFGCPNRPEGRTGTGCTYCDESGSRAPYLGEADSPENQVRRAVPFIRKRYGAKCFSLYFQAFSGTNAPVEKLKKIYDASLKLHPFKELIVSTRPDCVSKEKIDLLVSYKERGLDVWVELGLQSAWDATLKRIRRGHDVKTFSRAFEMVSRAGLNTAIHLIFGLPGEGWSHIEKTIQFAADLKPNGIKIHNLNIPVGTPLFNEYLSGEITVPHFKRFANWVIQSLRMLPPDTVIMRLTCDTLPEKRAAPRYFPDKNNFYRYVIETMKKQDYRQGDYYQ